MLNALGQPRRPCWSSAGPATSRWPGPALGAGASLHVVLAARPGPAAPPRPPSSPPRAGRVEEVDFEAEDAETHAA